jgi:hypothetical protein
MWGGPFLTRPARITGGYLELKKYYVLGTEGEPVLIELGYEPGYGQILAPAVYTTEDGDRQQSTQGS